MEGKTREVEAADIDQRSALQPACDDRLTRVKARRAHRTRSSRSGGRTECIQAGLQKRNRNETFRWERGVSKL